MSSLQKFSRLKAPSSGVGDDMASTGKGSSPEKQSKLAVPTKRAVPAMAEPVIARTPKLDEKSPRVMLSTQSRLPTSSSVAKVAVSRLPEPKPQFHTYQQHYSPKKTERPIAPPASREDTGSYATESADTLYVRRLRDELLQLQLVYEQPRGMSDRYRQHKAESLRRCYDHVRKKETEIQNLSSSRQKRTNAVAVEIWLSHRDAEVSAIQAKALSHCMQRLQLLSDAGSNLSSLLHELELWHKAVVVAGLSKDENGSQRHFKNPLLLQELRESWAEEISFIEKELGSICDMLRDTSVRHDDSALHAAFEAYTKLASVLHAEVQACLLAHHDVQEMRKNSSQRLLSQLQLSAQNSATSKVGQHRAIKKSWD